MSYIVRIYHVSSLETERQWLWGKAEYLAKNKRQKRILNSFLKMSRKYTALLKALYYKAISIVDTAHQTNI